MSRALDNKYVFHWLSLERLEKFDRAAELKPYWRHFILAERRMVKGISTCFEPMCWSPDAGQRREPCLVIDRARIDAPIHIVDSGPTYHLTREIKRRLKDENATAKAIEQAERMVRMSRSNGDEYFIEGTVPWDAVVALGYERELEAESGDPQDLVDGIAARRNLPVVDMTGWVVGGPGVSETDEIVSEALATAMEREIALPIGPAVK